MKMWQMYFIACQLWTVGVFTSTGGNQWICLAFAAVSLALQILAVRKDR